MSKKKLLEESTVRKFMKFANIGHLAENYLDENEMYEEEEEEGLEAAGEELPPEAGEEIPMDDEFPAEEGGAVEMGEKEELLAQVVQAVADTLGVEAEVEGAGEVEPSFLPADEAGLEDLEGEEGLEGLEDEGEGEMMPPEEEMMQESYDPQQLRNYLISEVSNRIRARAQHEQQQRALYEQQLQQQALYEHQVKQQAVAQQEAKKQQLAESLANRIFTRLKGKKQKK